MGNQKSARRYNYLKRNKMTIGAGIAIAGIWIFAGIIGASKYTTTSAVWLALIIAVIFTIYLAKEK